MSPFPGLLPPSQHGGLPKTNLVLWYDFSDVTTLWKTDTQGNNPSYSDQASADGDAIAAVQSLIPASTSDLPLCQRENNSAKYPVMRVTSPLLGTRCLDFDGTDDFISTHNRTSTAEVPATSFSLDTNAKTTLISFRADVWATAGNFIQLFGLQNNWNILLFDSDKVYFQNNGGGSNIQIGSLAINTNYVAMFRYNGTNQIAASINGAAESTAASSDTNSMGGAFQLGALADGSLAFNGRVGEIAMWNVDLASQGSDLATAITYFTDKWT